MWCVLVDVEGGGWKKCSLELGWKISAGWGNRHRLLLLGGVGGGVVDRGKVACRVGRGCEVGGGGGERWWNRFVGRLGLWRAVVGGVGKKLRRSRRRKRYVDVSADQIQ